MPVTLTDSERMALCDIVLRYLLLPDHTDVFVDAARQVETTPEQLLQRLMEAELGPPE